MELRGQRVSLRPTQPADAPLLARILEEPEVAAWWGRFDIGRVRDELVGERDDDEGFVIEHDGEVVGYIQLSEEDDPEFRHAGIDLFLRTDVRTEPLAHTSSTCAATTA